MKRVGIYIRVSTEEQARIQDGSLVSQKNRLLEYIEFQNKRESNWGTLVDIYCDEGKSAKNMKGRPEFLRMLTDVKLGRINLIVATELSRLNRNILLPPAVKMFMAELLTFSSHRPKPNE